MNILLLIARILYSAVFIQAGIGHIFQPDELADYAKSKNVPFPKMSVIFTGLLNLLGGLSILLGLWVNIGAWLLIVFLVPTAFIMHNFWVVDDPMQRQNEQIHFLKDLSMAGAAYMIWYLYVVVQHAPLSL
ncbi:MAG TPA: DoxX family protein [Balneolaceae bacterium]|nr:DoxX family protein [Balneolaceae bacterium]